VLAAYEACKASLNTFITSSAQVRGKQVTLPHPGAIPTDAIFSPAQDEWAKITGERTLSTHALFHHRIASYGPPCPACGKPLRTVKARSCAACGQIVAVPRRWWELWKRAAH
jgi:hypothetical protein